MFGISNEIFSICIIMGIATVLSCFLLSLAYILSSQEPTSKKLSAYECGFQKFMSLSLPFDIHFYRVGILFLIFYVEIAFLFPWAVCFNQISWMGQLSILLFLFILLFGFVIEWKMKALIWN